LRFSKQKADNLSGIRRIWTFAQQKQKRSGGCLTNYVNTNALPLEPLAAKTRDETAREYLLESDKNPPNKEGLELEQEQLS